MKLNTPSERFFVFMAITMLFGVGYQQYFNYQVSKTINKTIETNNSSVKKYVKMIADSQKKNSELKAELDHTKKENESLVEQIDHVANTYQLEVIKLKEQLNELKYETKTKSKKQ